MWNVLGVKMGETMAEAAKESTAAAFLQIEQVFKEIEAERPVFSATMTARIAIKPAFDAVNEQAAAYALERGAEMVGKRLVNGVLIDNPNAQWTITEPTREWLRRLVNSAFEDGMSPADLAKEIQANQTFSKSRAQMIAHTEIGNINVATHAAAAIKAGATHKRSFLSANHDHDDFCDLAAEAGEVTIDHDYGFGLKWPLYHPRCCCSESFYWRKKPKAKQLTTG